MPAKRLFAYQNLYLKPGQLHFHAFELGRLMRQEDFALPPSLKPHEIAARISGVRTIEFDSFSLVEDGRIRMPANEKELDLLARVFPGAQSVGVFLPTVVVRYEVLPAKPWPLSVAGLPVYFTTDGHSVGFDYGRLGGSRAAVLAEHDARDFLSENLMESYPVLRRRSQIGHHICS